MTLTGPALVTGALGQDGFILCRRLRERGVAVVGVVRPGGGHAQRRHVLEIKMGCRLVGIELTEPESLTALVKTVRPQSIFHLAAAHHSSEGTETPDTWRSMIVVNILVAETLARAAVAEGLDCPLIYASSSQIWKAYRPDQPVDETTPVDPATFYGHTKVWAAELLRQYRNRHGLKTSIAFLFNHESPWRSANYVTRKISMAAARAACGDKTPLRLTNLGSRIDWQAAEDVVDALALMAEASTPDDYVLASGRSYQVKEFVEAAYGHAGLDWRGLVHAERDQGAAALVGVADKAKLKLGWRPSRSFEQVVKDMVDADLARLAGTMQT